jgi:DUF2075 family protein
MEREARSETTCEWSFPKATLWAHDPRGVDQVGCVYTAQGFEFDYVGVIWGTDLDSILKRRIGSLIKHARTRFDRKTRESTDFASL